MGTAAALSGTERRHTSEALHKDERSTCQGLTVSLLFPSRYSMSTESWKGAALRPQEYSHYIVKSLQ